jgi:hypothetical protein
MTIRKSAGVTPTERLLASLCERSFLALWSYPSPYKDDGKELCDLLAVFEDRAFVFFDREARHLDDPDLDPAVAWERWRRNAVERQIATARGAERYLRSGRPIFLDARCTVPFPLNLPLDRLRIHRIVVAHGAAEACKAASPENVSGSLAISYGQGPLTSPFPFQVHLERDEPIHLLDSNTLPIVLEELDTVSDFAAFLDAKEEAIRNLDLVLYCGEEDLIAHYFSNFQPARQRYEIRPSDQLVNALWVEEGAWHRFIERPEYHARKAADAPSYFWDTLVQKTAGNALNGTLISNHDALRGRSPLHEMAKEPRLSRRALAERILDASNSFPDLPGRVSRKVTYVPSFYPRKGYVFLQLRDREAADYNVYRERRRAALQIACGALKNRMPELTTIVGIAVEPPRFHERISEDFLLLDCTDWPDEARRRFDTLNEGFKFFATENLQVGQLRVQMFPSTD